MTDPSPPPMNADAERALLGSMILENRLADDVLQLFPPHLSAQAAERVQSRGLVQRGVRNHLFGVAANELIYGALVLHAERGEPATLQTVSATLQDCGLLDAVGGSPYIGSLEDDIFALGQVPQLARAVLENWRRREVIMHARDAIAAIGDGAPAEQTMRALEAGLSDLDGQARRDWTPATEAQQVARGLIEREPGEAGISMGLAGLDGVATLRPGNLAILAARPSIGKTALALNIAAHVALRLGLPVGMFSVEMDYASVVTRMIASEGPVSYDLLTSGRQIVGPERAVVEDAARRIAGAPLWVDESGALSLPDVQRKARRLAKRAGGLGLIVIDYMQLMSGGGRKYENRQQEVTTISSGLKALSKELRCPVLALSQLSRSIEQRGKRDSMPKLSDLRESGAIEQDADLVMFIHRDFRAVRTSPTGFTAPTAAQLIVAKQRNGQRGTFDLLFDGAHQRFMPEQRTS